MYVLRKSNVIVSRFTCLTKLADAYFKAKFIFSTTGPFFSGAGNRASLLTEENGYSDVFWFLRRRDQISGSRRHLRFIVN